LVPLWLNPNDKPRTTPKLDAMPVHKAFRLLDCKGIVRTNQRLIAIEKCPIDRGAEIIQTGIRLKSKLSCEPTTVRRNRGRPYLARGLVRESNRARPKCGDFCHRKEDQYLSARIALESATVLFHWFVADWASWSHGWHRTPNVSFGSYTES
jgi:hypothetical protein